MASWFRQDKKSLDMISLRSRWAVWQASCLNRWGTECSSLEFSMSFRWGVMKVQNYYSLIMKDPEMISFLKAGWGNLDWLVSFLHQFSQVFGHCLLPHLGVDDGRINIWSCRRLSAKYWWLSPSQMNMQAMVPLSLLILLSYETWLTSIHTACLPQQQGDYFFSAEHDSWERCGVCLCHLIWSHLPQGLRWKQIWNVLAVYIFSSKRGKVT